MVTVSLVSCLQIIYSSTREHMYTSLSNFVSESVIMPQIAEEANNAETIAASVSHDIIQYT